MVVVAAIRSIHRHELEQIVVRVKSPLMFVFFLVWTCLGEGARIIMSHALRIEALSYVIVFVLIPYEILRGWLPLLAFSFPAEALSFLLLVALAVIPAMLEPFSFLRR